MSDRAHVPCNGCRACCTNELLVLHPEHGDIIGEYLHKPAFNPITQQPCFALQNKPNGECIYLGDSGCTIHERAPVVCRKFDCRALVKSLGARPAIRRMVKTGLITQEIVDAARRAASGVPASGLPLKAGA